MYTIRHYKRDFTNLRVAIVGDILHSRVARSDIHGLTTLGAPEVRVDRPEDAGADARRGAGRTRVPRHARGARRLRRGHHAAAAERAHERRAAAVGRRVLQELRADRRTSSRWPSPMRSSCIPGRSTAASRSTRRSPTARRRVILPQVTFGIAVRMAVMCIIAGNVPEPRREDPDPQRPLVDPTHGVDRATSLYVAAGRIAAIGSAPAGFAPNRVDRRARRSSSCPGLVDLSRAAARARPRAQGDARIRDRGGRRRRRHQPGVPARHRSGARRAGPGRDAEVPRALAQPRARLSARRADARPRRRRADRDGRARRGGLRRLLAGRGAARDTQVLLRAMQYAATFGYRVWLRPQEPHLAQGRRRARRRGGDAPRPGRRAGRPPRRSRWRRSSSWCARPARACTCAGCRSAAGVALVRAAKGEGLPVTCDVAIHHLHLSDVDIGYFDAQCAAGAAAARHARSRRAARGARRRHDRPRLLDHTPVDDDGKQLPFAEAEPGATGLELLLPLALKWANEDARRPRRGAGENHARARASCWAIDAGTLAVGSARRRVHVRSDGALDSRARAR